MIRHSEQTKYIFHPGKEYASSPWDLETKNFRSLYPQDLESQSLSNSCCSHTSYPLGSQRICLSLCPGHRLRLRFLTHHSVSLPYLGYHDPDGMLSLLWSAYLATISTAHRFECHCVVFCYHKRKQH